MKITEAVIEELPEDMDEIIVDEGSDKVIVSKVSKRLSKDCFCFPNTEPERPT